MVLVYRAGFAFTFFEDAFIVDRHDLDEFRQRGIECIEHLFCLRPYGNAL